jgi:adenine phosphoribosyltransferase
MTDPRRDREEGAVPDFPASDLGASGGTAASAALSARVLAALRDVPDFPKPGIRFKDITPLLADAALFADATRALAAAFAEAGVTHVAGVESRGFILGAPVAQHLGVGFIPVRKPGKLPWRTTRRTYELEYGTDALEAHSDACGAGSRVLVVDDVLATGGTAEATCALVEEIGGTVVGCAFLLEIAPLGGRDRLAGRPLHVVLRLA